MDFGATTPALAEQHCREFDQGTRPHVELQLQGRDVCRLDLETALAQNLDVLVRVGEYEDLAYVRLRVEGFQDYTESTCVWGQPLSIVRGRF